MTACHRPPLPEGSIGIFDSGVGGLSVWREVAKLLPNEHLIYLADQAHIPYGPRPLHEVRGFAEGIVRFFAQSGVKLVVVACNTASAAALSHLRETFDIPIVGMEPAVKPATLHTRTGRVGVIATPATFQGEPYARLLARYARGVDVLAQPCPGLVEQVERGDLDGPATMALLHRYLDPLVGAGVDQLVLGCTHYPFLREAIEQVVGPDVEIIDPAPAVARQVVRVLESVGRRESPGAGGRIFYTTGTDASVLAGHLFRLLGVSAHVCRVEWSGGEIGFPAQPKA